MCLERVPHYLFGCISGNVLAPLWYLVKVGERIFLISKLLQNFPSLPKACQFRLKFGMVEQEMEVCRYPPESAVATHMLCPLSPILQT